MSRVWVLPEAIIHDIDAMANELGRDAFPHNGNLHYYSGPCPNVWALIAGEDQEKNRQIAIKWARAHGAMVIDDSPIGKFLENFEGMGTRKYFARNPLITGREEKDKASLDPWKHASHLLALSAHGQVTTTVNGADRKKGVYYGVELKNTLMPNYQGLSATEFLSALATPRKKEVQNVNMLPFQEVLAKKDHKGVEAAHTMIQLGAIRMALHEALETSKPSAIKAALKVASKEVLRSPTEAYKYFLESQERFMVDRALQMQGTPAGDRFLARKTPAVRQKRRYERLDQFASNVLLLIETEIALMPPSDRPDFIVPSYVKAHAPR